MRKDKLISKTAKDSGYAVWEIELITKVLKKNMHEALLNGEDVIIRGFGRYHIEITPAFVRHSKRNNNNVAVPEHRALIFKTSTKLSLYPIGKQLKPDDK